MSQEIISKKVPLHEALLELSQIMEIIDEEGTLPALLEKNWETAKADFGGAVSRRVSLIQILPGLITETEAVGKEWAKKGNQLKGVLERVKAHTMELMRCNPDLSFKCDIGEFRIQRNAVPSLVNEAGESWGEILGKKSVSNILSEADMETIPSDYVEAKTFFTLATKKLTEELKKGSEFSWAKLDLGEHLRIGK